jgi:hypothetical protein
MYPYPIKRYEIDLTQYLRTMREYSYEDYSKFIRIGRVIENNLSFFLFPISTRLKEEILSKGYEKY